jgi:hypothetical protein
VTEAISSEVVRGASEVARWARGRPGAPRADEGAAPDAAGVDVSRSGALLCASCRSPVTEERARVAVEGATRHERVNPAGYAFLVDCFAVAPGGRPLGEPSSEFAWFPRYAWRVVVCARCHAHLGWRFDGPDTFFGLRVDMLVSEDLRSGEPPL